jgi:hypothetical protein
MVLLAIRQPGARVSAVWLQDLKERLETSSQGFQTRHLFHLQEKMGDSRPLERWNNQSIVEGVGFTEFLQDKYHSLCAYLPDLIQKAAARIVEGM